jgi:hypothetical protein
VHGIHDQLFKGLAVAFPGDLVTLLLPEVAARIDLGHLRFESKEFFLDTPTGRRRFPDLVSRARGRSDPDDESVVHVEHFSRYRVACRSRVWDYQRLLASATSCRFIPGWSTAVGDRPAWSRTSTGSSLTAG